MQEGRSQGWAGSLSVALPGSLGPWPKCHQNCMCLGYVYDFRAEANHVGWFGLWKTLEFPKAPHLHPYSVSNVSLLPLMPQVFAQPATPSARVASSQTSPFSGQNPTGDSRLYPGLPRHTQKINWWSQEPPQTQMWEKRWWRQGWACGWWSISLEPLEFMRKDTLWAHRYCI